MERETRLIIHHGALYHNHSAHVSTNPDDEMLEYDVFDEDQEGGDEDEAMTPTYYSFDEASESGTATPNSTSMEPVRQHETARNDASLQDDDMEQEHIALPSGSSTHSIPSRPSDSREHPSKKNRYESTSVAPGFERGTTKYRSGQTLTANKQLMSTLQVTRQQHERDLALARTAAFEEVKAEYGRYVSGMEEAARQKEQAYQEEWRRITASIAENAEVVEAERQRASKLALAVQEKDRAVEEMRLKARDNELELRAHLLAIEKDNEALRLSQAKVQRETAAQFELLKQNLRQEADTTSARTRAEVAEAALLQKELEIATARQREEEMKATIESMKRAQEEFRRSQELAQQEMLAKFEQIKADKDREVAIALQQKKRMKTSPNSTAASNGQPADDCLPTTSNSTHSTDIQPMDEDSPGLNIPVRPSTPTGTTRPMEEDRRDHVPLTFTPHQNTAEGTTNPTAEASTPVRKSVNERIKAKRGKATHTKHANPTTPASTVSKEKVVDPVASDEKAADPVPSTGEPMDEDRPGPIPPGGKDLMERIKAKKQALHKKTIPVLKRALAIEDEETNTGGGGPAADADADADSEHDSDSELEDNDGQAGASRKPKGKGTGKGKSKGKDADTGKADSTDKLTNLEALIVGAVQQAMANLAPNLGMTTTSSSPEKKSRQSLINAAVIAEAKRHSKDAKNGISEVINSVIQGAFDLESNDDWYVHVPPTVDQVALFNKTAKGGPNPNDLRVDMKGTISSDWNVAVIQILLALVVDEMKDEDLSWLPKCSDEFLRSRIRKRIENGRAFYQKTKAKIAEDGTAETEQEIEDRLIAEKAAADAKARAHARRKAGGSPEDIALWKWLALLLEKLGKDGMSSEESEVEEGSARGVYYVKKLPWRRSDTTKHVRFIDKQREIANGLYSRRGNAPVPRIINHTNKGGVSRRPAPPGRPRAIYEEEWLQKQHSADVAKLDISDEIFPWREYYSVGMA
ncbi:hypothetical protein HYPSUDRAFT_57199 [Hypholoma sublateritium FD-334 SS-4]|uniref:Uncharacterized protein n=1 Tax=Hypholoma sublateritium (strain FD-334 SS-4) TaxID=945553 RepID=A0A0D2NHC4_HYPSF|nr:hypothetical protein HYPSUDRAFT_57199 [Hypholoma sublateritium FD-334 SS-4]